MQWNKIDVQAFVDGASASFSPWFISLSRRLAISWNLKRERETNVAHKFYGEGRMAQMSEWVSRMNLGVPSMHLGSDRLDGTTSTATFVTKHGNDF